MSGVEFIFCVCRGRVNRVNTSINVGRPDATGISQAVHNPTTSPWFNPAAFVVSPRYSFGNAARNSVMGPRGFYLDFSTHKEFRRSGGR